MKGKGISLIILSIFLISFATIINMNTTTTASTTSTTTYNQDVKLVYKNITYYSIDVISNTNTSKYYKALSQGIELSLLNGLKLVNGTLENTYTSVTRADFYNVTTTYYILSYYYPVEVNVNFVNTPAVITQKILAYNFTLFNKQIFFNSSQAYIVYSTNGTTVFSTTGQLLYHNGTILPFIVHSATPGVVKVLANTTNITSTTLLQNATLSKPPQIIYTAPANLYTTTWYKFAQSVPPYQLYLYPSNFSTQMSQIELISSGNYSSEINNISITFFSSASTNTFYYIIRIISKTPIAVVFNEFGSSEFKVINEVLGYYLPNGTIAVKEAQNITAVPSSQFTQYNYSEIVINSTTVGSTALSPTTVVDILAQPIEPPNYIINLNENSISSTQYNVNSYSTTSISQNTVNQANISSPVSVYNNTLIYTLEQHKEAVAIGLGVLILIMIIVIAVTTAEGGRFK